MKTRKITLALIASIFLLSGCLKEPVTSRLESNKVTVQIKTKAFIGSEYEEITISKVRFMLFLNGDLLNNYTTSNGTLEIDGSGEFSLAVSPGEYHFATIINESPELTEKLNAITSLTDIDQISCDWQKSAFTQKNIPLVNLGEIKIAPGSVSGQGLAQILSIYNSDGTKYKGGFSNPSANISIDMPRVLSQISLFLRKGDDITEEVKINNVQIVNIPRYSYLADQLETDNTKLNIFTGPDTTILATGGDKSYNNKQYHTFPSAIIPEKSFFDKSLLADDEAKASNPENAAYLFINATYGGVPTTYKILLREGDLNFRLLRNTNYNVYATITQIGSKGIYAIIEPVQMHNITVNWKPVEGLVIVSDREADFGKNVNVWSDYTVYSGILKVYKGDAFQDVLFKYGSLIAVSNDVTATSEQGFTPPVSAENTSDVVWYPGGFNVTGITNWENIPYITDGSNFTSGNTQALVTQAKGDPCRMAALSPHQIGVEGKIDNQQWHMATPTEYALLMKAENGVGSENTNGFRSFHELLIPNVKYRNENGVLQSAHNNRGCYWSTEANQAFSFNSQDLTQTKLAPATGTQGYTVRCVRNNIPAADIVIYPVKSVVYYGSLTYGSDFQIHSNVPYWKLELLKEGEHQGNSTDFNDFSFEPFTTGIKHVVEGSYSKTPKVYIERWESRTKDRTFGVKFSSIHFNGEEHTYYFTITQNKYSIKGILTINNTEDNNRIHVNGGKHTMRINLTSNSDRTDIPIPVGASLKVEYSYNNIIRGTSTTVITTASDKYEYEVEMDMLPNGTPDVIGLNFKIYMDEGTGYKEIGRADYYQNNK